MQKSNAPAIITVPFASGAGAGYRNTVPIPSQIPVTPGAASWTDGFPPLTMTPSGAGGIPPYGQDMNGVLYAETTNTQWLQLGYVGAWSSSVSTAIGGYPAGARLLRSDGLGHWLNLSDNNTTNPDATGATGWVAQRANAGVSTIVVASGTVTPDPSVLGVPLLVLSGTLTANVTLVLPLTRSGASWRIYNATSGSFTVNVQGATGAGVTASQGQLTDVTTDGTNFYSVGLSGGPFLPLTGTAVAAAKLATARTIAMTGPVTWSVSFDGSANVSAASTIAAGSVTLAMMANLTANTLLGNPTGAAAAPQAIPLVNGIIFNGSSLGLGNITPTSLVVNASGFAATGVLTVDTSASGAQNVQIKNTFASGGGAQIYMLGQGSTTPSKTLRVFAGVLQVVNDNNTAAVLSLTDAGALTVIGSMTSSQSFISSTVNCVLATTGAGALFLRPNGAGSSSGQTTIDSSGNLTATGNITSNGGVFQSATTAILLGPTGAGTIYLRPNGVVSSTGQVTVDASGNLVAAGSLTAGGNITAQGGNFQTTGSECDVSISYNNSANFGYYFSVNSTGFGINIRNGSGGYAATPLSINTSSGQVSVNTQLNVSGNINKTSDLRLKKVLAYPEPRQLASVGLIRYQLLGDSSGKVMIGLPAQGIHALAPEHIEQDLDTGILRMDYTSVAVEQSWRNAADIRQLRAELEALKQRVH